MVSLHQMGKERVTTIPLNERQELYTQGLHGEERLSTSVLKGECCEV